MRYLSLEEGPIPYVSTPDSPSRLISRLFLLALPLWSPSWLVFALPLCAQSGAAGKPAAPAPDVIFFTNGDQLTGKLLREIGGSVTFHSDIAGDVIVTWDKIKSIHSSQKFAVIQQGQHVTRKTPDADVAQGSVQVQDDQVQVTTATGGATKEIPVKNAQYMIDEDTYGKEVHRNPGFGYGWNGSLTAGATSGRGDTEQPRLYRRRSAGKDDSHRNLA